MAEHQGETLLYEGKAKAIYATADPDRLRVEFKDDATAFDGTKHDRIAGKGRLNRDISALLFEYLAAAGLPNHFVAREGERSMRVERLTMVPVEVVVRNVVAGSLARRLGLAEGEPLARPVIELYLKNDALHDPMINESHVAALGLAGEAEMRAMAEQAREVNRLLLERFERAALRLIDFKLEFGRRKDGSICLGDEVSPDTCRLWDAASGTRLDKDRFRRDLGDLIGAYREVLERLSRSR